MFFCGVKQLDELHSKQSKISTCARLRPNYWVGFMAANEQDPIKVASFYKESGHK